MSEPHNYSINSFEFKTFMDKLVGELKDSIVASETAALKTKNIEVKNHSMLAAKRAKNVAGELAKLGMYPDEKPFR